MNPNKIASLDYMKLARDGRKLDTSGLSQGLRIGLLSDAATQQFVPILTALLGYNGVRAEFYEGAFDAMQIESINPASGLYSFRPDVVVLLNSTQALRTRYYERGEEGELERLMSVWDAVAAHSTCRIIQCNFPLPYDRPFGQLDLKRQSSLYAKTLTLNARMAERAAARSDVLLCDMDAVASHLGRRHWFDERLWDLSKTFCNLEHLPLAAQALVDLMLAGIGRVVKCVVLDLDNTLWGGVVGDLGALGIQIGAHGDGEPFYRFQHYLRSLKQRGILLAVCSKNEEKNALAAFDENPHMVLKREDIAVFVANWDNKADNIRIIRETLEIGYDSMVFLDDNPFERNLVRTFLPEVIVPDLPEDPADYVRAVSELNLFETTAYSAEDAARSDLYRQEADRRVARAAFTDLSEYLRSLDMRIAVERFRPEKIERISQLFLRSNQFNLTTHRHGEAECTAMMREENGCLPLCASLTDQYGDHGLISVVVARPEAGTLRVSDWIMSCRVLSRGVEQYLMNHLFAIARERGLGCVTGEYRPSGKNGLVKDFWSQFGFGSADGRYWSLSTSSYTPQTAWISESQAAESAPVERPPDSAP